MIKIWFLMFLRWIVLIKCVWVDTKNLQSMYNFFKMINAHKTVHDHTLAASSWEEHLKYNVADNWISLRRFLLKRLFTFCDKRMWKLKQGGSTRRIERIQLRTCFETKCKFFLFCYLSNLETYYFSKKHF